MKYKNTPEDARKYNQTKDPTNKTADCSGCGEKVPMSGEACVAFGVYACQACRRKEKKGAVMIIENNRQAMRAMTIAFKLANKSLGKSRPRRLQCLATAKKLIAAADAFTDEQARTALEKEREEVGQKVQTRRRNLKGEKMIKDDKPQDAEPATPEEREAILEKLAAHLPPTRVINMDGEKRRGTLVKKPTEKPLP